MFKTLIYKKSPLNEDITYDIAEILHRQRNKLGKSLEEVCKEVRVDLLEMDSLECGHGDINFATLARLLDFYDLKLRGGEDCFPDLPEDFYSKYFC